MGFNFEADPELKDLYAKLRGLEASAARIREELQEKVLQKMRREGLLDRRQAPRRTEDQRAEDRRAHTERRVIRR